MAGLAGLNLIYESAGMHASLLGFCLESLIIDNDMLGHCLRCVRGIEVSDAALSIDTIADVCLKGPGHYLGNEQTLRLMQTEYFYPAVGDRFSPKEWNEKGKPDILQRAIAEKKRVLASRFPRHVPKTRRRQAQAALWRHGEAAAQRHGRLTATATSHGGASCLFCDIELHVRDERRANQARPRQFDLTRRDDRTTACRRRAAPAPVAAASSSREPCLQILLGGIGAHHDDVLATGRHPCLIERADDAVGDEGECAAFHGERRAGPMRQHEARHGIRRVAPRLQPDVEGTAPEDHRADNSQHLLGHIRIDAALGLSLKIQWCRRSPPSPSDGRCLPQDRQ